MPECLLLICQLALLLPLQGLAASLSMSTKALTPEVHTASAPPQSQARKHCEQMDVDAHPRSDQTPAENSHTAAQKPAAGCGSCSHCCLDTPPPAELARLSTLSVRRAPHRLSEPLPESVISATLERPPRRANA